MDPAKVTYMEFLNKNFSIKQAKEYYRITKYLESRGLGDDNLKDGT